jgi:hypothetical protein
VNRAQIERAEKAAEHLANRRHLINTIKTAPEPVNDDVSRLEGMLGARNRRNVYVDQVRKFEARREAVSAFLIAEGVLDEREVPRAGMPVKYRPSEEDMVFEDWQLEVALRSVQNRV